MHVGLFLGSALGRVLTDTKVSPWRIMLPLTLSNFPLTGRDRMAPHYTGLQPHSHPCPVLLTISL